MTSQNVKRGKVFVVVGGQFGSEGKGAVSGRIARDLDDLGMHSVGVRVGGPNAGHTVYGRCPRGCKDKHPLEPNVGGAPGHPHPWRLRQVPVAAVASGSAQLMIAAGSEIDPDVLASEIEALDSARYRVTERLVIDRSATLMWPDYALQEQERSLSESIGSTAKGIGAARADRIWRSASTWGQTHTDAVDTAELLRDAHECGHHIVIEGTQGYGLGLHTEFYPQTTSGDCRAIDFLAQVGLSPWTFGHNNLRVVVVFRANPIRVAGPSGPLKDETSWAELGLPEELTTVTRKVRRVGGWDADLARAAMIANGFPSHQVSAAFTMADTIAPQFAGCTMIGLAPPELDSWLAARLAEVGNPALSYVGTGPDAGWSNERMYR